MDWDGKIDREIDCEGLLCPLPVLRAAKVLRGMAPGAVLRVRATDRMAAIDLPHFCVQAGHVFLSAGERDGVGIYLIQRGDGDGQSE
jgi:tRNA 2-thiouridine synthesizing protein A